MSRSVLAAAVLLLVPGMLSAQEAERPANEQQDPQAAYNALAKSFNQAMNAWQEERDAAIAKAEADGTRVPRSVLTPPTRQFIATAQELADKYAGKDEAIPFLTFIVKNAYNERNAVKKAVQTLADVHADSPAIGDALRHLGNAERFGAAKIAMALLDSVIEKHSEANCKAKALIVRGGLRLAAGQTEAGAADLRSVPGLTEDEELLAEAKEALFEVEKLAIGATAPDIEGVDVDGVEFKLSDYRGKVVLLDFWGFW